MKRSDAVEIKPNVPFIAVLKSDSIFEMQKLAGTKPTCLNKLILRTFSCLQIQRLLLCVCDIFFDVPPLYCEIKRGKQT